ncbi:MAG: hypothetical protein ACKVWR_18580, partial [Acidimicrobiales bacterium]
GFDFLGFHHRWVKAPGRNLWFLARWPSRRSMARARQRLRELTSRALIAAPTEQIIARLNRFLVLPATRFDRVTPLVATADRGP